MAITGISAISGEQIIAAGAVSAKEAGKASFTTGGNDIQNLYDTVSTNSASWTSTPISFPLNVTDQNVYVAKNADTGMPHSAVASNRGLSSYFIVDAGRPRQVDSTGIVNYNGLSLETVDHYTNNTANANYSVSGIRLSDNNSTGNIGIESIQNWNSTRDTVSANSASWGGGPSYTGDAQGALDEVYSKSANWDGSYDTLTANSAAWTSTNNTVSQRSGNWNKAYTTVTGNSAAWGGSALPISAGPGVKMDVVNDTLVFSNDEKVLWSGTTGDSTHTTAFTLTEPLTSYERIRFEGYQYGKSTPVYEITTPNGSDYVGVCFNYFCFNNDGNPYQIRCGSYSSNNGLDYTLFIEKFLFWSNTSLSAAGGKTTQGPNINKIVGINRTASN